MAANWCLDPAVTGTFTLPLTAYLIMLSYRVVHHRAKNQKWLGDRHDNAAEVPDSSDPDPLYLDSRAHCNFLENVPYTVLLATLVELNGGSRKVLSGVLGTFFVLRVLHVEIGLKGKDSIGIGRPLAYFGTLGTMAGLSAWSAYLVKGYWGF